MAVEREFSAGGVVRRFRGRPFIAAVRVKNGTVLALPKGHIDGGETAPEAAAREVREETGVEGELVEKLGDVKYWYQREGKRVFFATETANLGIIRRFEVSRSPRIRLYFPRPDWSTKS